MSKINEQLHNYRNRYLSSPERGCKSCKDCLGTVTIGENIEDLNPNTNGDVSNEHEGDVYISTDGSTWFFDCKSDTWVVGSNASVEVLNIYTTSDSLTSPRVLTGAGFNLTFQDIPFFLVQATTSTNILSTNGGNQAGVASSLGVTSYIYAQDATVNNEHVITTSVSAGGIDFSGKTATVPYQYGFPAYNATAGQILQNNGAGNIDWVDISGLSVDNIYTVDGSTNTRIVTVNTGNSLTFNAGLANIVLDELTDTLTLGDTLAQGIKIDNGVANTVSIGDVDDNSNSTLLVVDDANTKMVFTGGNAGFGITSPLYRVDVRSSAFNTARFDSSQTSNYISIHNAVTGSSATTDGLLIGINASSIAQIINKEAASLQLGTSGSTRLDITSTGVVKLNSYISAPIFNTAATGSYAAWDSTGNFIQKTATEMQSELGIPDIGVNLQNTFFVDPNGYSGINILEAVKGNLRKPWGELSEVIQDTTNATPFADLGHVEVSKGIYNFTRINVDGTGYRGTLSAFPNTSYRFIPNSTINVFDNGATAIDGTLLNDFLSTNKAGVTSQRKIVIQAEDCTFAQDATTPYALMFFYEYNSSLAATFGTLSTENAPLGYFAVNAVDIKSKIITLTTGSAGFFLGAQSRIGTTTTTPTDRAVQKLQVGKYIHNQTAVTTGAAQSIYVGSTTSYYTKSSLTIDADLIHITGFGVGALAIVQPAVGTNSTVAFKCRNIIDEGTFVNTYMGDYVATAPASEQAIANIHHSGITGSTNGWSNIDIDVEKQTTGRCNFVLSGALPSTNFSLVNENIIVNIGKATSTLYNNIRLYNNDTKAINLINTKLTIVGDYTANAQTSVVMYNINLDANSSITFKGRFKTDKAGGNVVFLRNITGVGANNIIFEDCTFINDGTAAAIGSTVAGQNVKIKNCYANSLIVSANVTELVELITKDADVI